MVPIESYFFKDIPLDLLVSPSTALTTWRILVSSIVSMIVIGHSLLYYDKVAAI
jgi:hypothetical protein